ncbi:MAG: V-type ATPase subunit [Endomicrobia bacterium]|nr:V-type ATPase subunit [Endomicrobiia bacterium]MCX7940653.1 V-type ATPase subunit [Endomicrobiia bacterium]MDW8056387.1 V-type ATPase subunit [Elusimicrobiota bacterium]
MNYTYQVAYLNAVKTKKIIPYQVLQDAEANKNFQTLISLLKDYKYNGFSLFNNPEVDIRASENFESIVFSELQSTTSLISKLLYDEHKWLVSWMQYFFSFKDTQELSDIIIFHKNYSQKFQSLHSILCTKLVKLIIDFENIQLFISYLILNKTDNLMFIPEGNIKEAKLKDCFPQIESLNTYLNTTFYPQIKLSPNLQKDNFYAYLDYYLYQLISESKFYYFTIEPIIFFFFEKLLETRRLKRIYYGIKLNLHL